MTTTRLIPNVERRLSAWIGVQERQGREPRRARFIERFLQCSMADTRYYHAVYNTEKSPFERIACSIIELLPPLTERSAER